MDLLYNTGGVVPIPSWFGQAASDDFLYSVAFGARVPPGGGTPEEELFGAGVRRPFITTGGGNAYTFEDYVFVRRANVSMQLSTPEYERLYGPQAFDGVALAQTPEDLYLVWPGGLSKLDKRDGLKTFTESLAGLRRHAVFAGGDQLWLADGPQLERYKAR